jgi:hypothetical protein
MGTQREGLRDRTGTEALIEPGNRVGCRFEGRLKATMRQRIRWIESH